jgi:hypothetical protein
MKNLKNKQYLFTFEGGGWNSVYAKTLKGAIKSAEKEYKDSPSLNPIRSSFCLATEEGLQNAMSLFY